MGISKTHGTKAPSMNPTKHYKAESKGSKDGGGGGMKKGGHMLSGGPMREKIHGKK